MFSWYNLTSANLGADPDFEPQYDSEYWMILIIGAAIFWVPAYLINKSRSPAPSGYEYAKDPNKPSLMQRMKSHDASKK